MPTVEGEGERLRFSTAKNYHSGPTERTAIACSVAHSDRRYISFLESGFGDFNSINLSKKGLRSAVTFGTILANLWPWRNAPRADSQITTMISPRQISKGQC